MPTTKKTNTRFFIKIFSLLLFIFSVSCHNNRDVLKNVSTVSSVSTDISKYDQQVEDLLSKMTTEEKFWQLFMIPGDLSEGKEKYKHGIFGFQVSTKGKSENRAEQLLEYSSSGTALETAEKINEIQKYFVEETRLGIPIIPFDEALHGLVRVGATAFPQSIALAATWDTALMNEVAEAIAMETKSRGIRQILSPVLNIARDVRWGRTEETYGEDPYLTSQMSLAYITQLEKNGIIATPKHFIANVGDGGRDSYPIHFNERILEEIYFPAFKTCIQKGNATSIMTSYNSLDGRPCTSNDWLLNKKLKDEWGFKGFVISDAGAVGGANVLHFTAKDYTDATLQSIENGLDVIFQTSYDHYPLFYDAFEKGLIDEDAVDDAVRRVLRAKFKLGLFDNPYVDPALAEKNNGNKEHREIAKKAALESIVLLKNENNTLPFNKEINSVAVIGSDAAEARLGGYSGPGNNTVSILEGIKNKLGKNCKINFAKGCERNSSKFITIPSENLISYQNNKKVIGLKAEYFNNISLEGEADLVRTDKNIDFRWTLFSPDHEKINYDQYSVRWTGKLIPDKSGDFEIGIYGDDGYRLYLNDELIIDNWKKQTVRQITKKYHFQKDKEYDLRLEFYETVGNVNFKLIWNAGVEDNWKYQIKNAVDIAKQSDIAIVVAGIEEGEFRDRASLKLPGHQEEIIKAIAKTGKPVTVVLVGGSAITMNNWINDINAIIDVWYPGDEGGNAVADVLFGDYNPAGRLPITFPIDESQLPLYYNHKPTGRGDDYVNLSGKALFPFGYGLSYTNFKYSDIKIAKQELQPDQTTEISFKITNTGNYDGDEVIQLYIKDLYASVARPVMELKAFKRIHLLKGETKEIKFEITPEMLSMLDINLNQIVEPGDFRIMLGASSNDIRLTKILTVK